MFPDISTVLAGVLLARFSFKFSVLFLQSTNWPSISISCCKRLL